MVKVYMIYYVDYIRAYRREWVECRLVIMTTFNVEIERFPICNWSLALILLVLCPPLFYLFRLHLPRQPFLALINLILCLVFSSTKCAKLLSVFNSALANSASTEQRAMNRYWASLGLLSSNTICLPSRARSETSNTHTNIMILQ